MTTTNEREALVEVLVDVDHHAFLSLNGWRCECGMAFRYGDDDRAQALSHERSEMLDAILAHRTEDGSEAVILASQVDRIDRKWAWVYPREVVRSGDIESNRTTEVGTP